MYSERLFSASQNIGLTKKELLAIDAVVTLLIHQGSDPYMIISSHPELGISVNTLYNYINQEVLLSRNTDLKRKVKFKPCKAIALKSKNREVFT